MIKSLLRAALVACLPLGLMALTVTPAGAADKAEGPKPSKAILKPLGDCQKALNAKNYPEAIVKCTDAEKASSELTDFDKYLISRYRGVAYFQMGDRAKAEESFVAVVKNPACPPDDFQTLIGPAMSLASEFKNYPLVYELGEIATAHNVTNPDVYVVVADAYYQKNDDKNAALYAQKGIDLAATQGKIPQYALYQILTFAYVHLKDQPNEIKGFQLMARDFGKAEDWKNLLDLSLSFLPQGNKTAREIAALDLYRLRLIVNAEWQATNFLEAADAAHSVRSWGDALTVLNLGIAKGVIDSKKVGPLLRQTEIDATRDKPILPQVEKSAKDAKALANVAEAYYGYGNYAEAVRTAQKAIDAGGLFAAEAKLVMALAQIKQGNEAAAKQTLAGFSGDPAFGRVAELLNLYLDRRYGAAAPAATK